MTRFHPLLSAKIAKDDPKVTEANFALIPWDKGIYGSIKYDGIRLFEYNMVPHTRSLKPLRNRHTSQMLEAFFRRCAEKGLRGVDGEVICGAPNDHNCMQNTTSGVMSFDGQPEFKFLCFDSYQHGQLPFLQRYSRMPEVVNSLGNEFPFVSVVEQIPILNRSQSDLYELDVLAQGYEGIMLRRGDAHYKLGRSTMREGILMALKRFEDDEAVIIDFVEEVENQNELETNELGYAKRSGHQENLVPKGRLGAFILKSPRFTETFRVGMGVGLTHALRQEIWDNREKYRGMLVKYRFQNIGVKDRPRLPKWVGFRHPDDV